MDLNGNGQDWKDIQNAASFSDLLQVALRVLRRMPQPIGMVCGPISTGGYGSTEKNLYEFNNTIECLRKQGYTVFSQIPFEQKLFELKQLPTYRGGLHLLEDFYLPIFESGLVSTLYFMPLWATSQGATWENGQGKRLKLSIVYLKTKRK